MDAVFTGSREQIIAEGEFLPTVEAASAGMLGMRKVVEEGAEFEWPRQFVSQLIREVHALRTVLNDHDAQENSTYSYFTELVAGIRGFAQVVYILKHLRERFLRSPLDDGDPRGVTFMKDLDDTLRFCGDTLRSLFAAFVVECGDLGLEVPQAELASLEERRDTQLRKRLPHNLDEEDLSGEGEKIAQVASSFVKAAEMYQSFCEAELSSYQELRQFVREKFDEGRARRLESFVHEIQSRYDTYIQYTAVEARTPELRKLRSIISVVLHLFEVATHMVHFYERHENDIRLAKTKERIAGVVNKRAVLDRAVNRVLRGAGWLMEAGRETALAIIPEFTSIREVVFPIHGDVKLHIRPAALIAAIVGHHGTPVTMRMGDGRLGENECDAGSVTEVIFLAGSNLDAREVVFLGDERPLEDLRFLFLKGLGDDSREVLETELSYLKRL